MQYMTGLVLSIIFSLLVCRVEAQSQDSVKVVSEEWELLTEKSGVGLYWEVLTAVYAEAGMLIVKDSSSYAQSVNKVMGGEADAWLGSSLDEVEGAIYPTHHLDIDHLYALVHKGDLQPWQGEASLEGRKVGWIKGYDYSEDLSVHMEVSEFSMRKVGFRRLLKGEIDVILDARYDITQAAIAENIDMAQFDLNPVMDQKIYVGFANTARGKQLRDLFDDGMTKLMTNGQLKQIFSHYPQFEYPY